MAETTLALPLGHLTLAEDGSAHAVLPASLRNRDAIIASVEAMARLRGGRSWIYDRQSENSEGLHLHWGEPGGALCPLSRIILEWRQEPATFLPRALELTRQVLRVASELELLRPLRFLLSPAQVFSVGDSAGNEHWVVMPLPVEGAGLADFMRADEVFLTWLSAESLLHAAPTDRGYMLGASLYGSLVADLLPPAMGRSERARRRLLSQVSNPARAQSALAAALPKPLAPLASRLTDLVIGQLRPALGRSLTSTQAVSELDRITEELTAQNLADHWEREGKPGNALKILNALARTAPAPDVPWEAVERLRAWAGDVSGAAEATMKRARSPQEQTSIFIARVRELVGGGEPQRRELERLVAALRGAIMAGSTKRFDWPADQAGSPITDEQYLYLAYVNGRWLANTDEALQWLRRDFSLSWHKVLQSLLAARLSAERATWIEVLHYCRDSRQSITRMPNAGGKAGRYAEVYVNLLDGIAQICAVESQNYPREYLTDAFARLAEAWSQLHEAEGEDLEPAILCWLSWLAELAGSSANLNRLRLGVEAFYQSLGFEPRRGDSVAPAIPWFDEKRLFSG